MIELHRRLRRFREEEGLGLVEVISAMGITFVALLALAYVVTGALGDIGFARQRQGATGLADRIMEQARGLPYEELTVQGLATSNLAADGRAVDCGGTYRFESCAGEEIIHSNRPSSPAAPPLVPHIDSFQPAGSETAYTRAIYVTQAAGAPSAGAFRVTVIVNWAERFTSGASKEVRTETLVYYPEACRDPALYPFPGPCIPEFTVDANAQQGGVTISGTMEGSPVTAVLHSVGLLGGGQLVQIRTTQGTILGSRAQLGTDTLGAQQAATLADNNPASPSGEYDSVAMPGGGTGTLSTSSGLTTLSVSRTGADTGDTTSAMAAGAPAPGGGLQVCPLASSVPASQSDGEPCGLNDARQAGQLSAELGLQAATPSGTEDLGTATLAKMPSQASPTYAFVDRIAVAGADGRTTVTAVRPLADVEFADVPVLFRPMNWEGYYVKLMNYTDTVTVEIGESTSAPSVTRSTNARVRYWTPLGYQEQAVPDGAGCTVPLSDFASGVILDGTVNVTVEISGALQCGGTATDDPDGPGAGVTRTRASAESASPIIGTLSYRVIVDGVTTSDFTYNINFGSLVADGSYQEAP